MPKTKKTKRTMDEIQTEYAQLCAQLGEFEHKRHTMALDCDTIKARLFQLNIEAKEINDGKAKSA